MEATSQCRTEDNVANRAHYFGVLFVRQFVLALQTHYAYAIGEKEIFDNLSEGIINTGATLGAILGALPFVFGLPSVSTITKPLGSYGGKKISNFINKNIKKSRTIWQRLSKYIYKNSLLRSDLAPISLAVFESYEHQLMDITTDEGDWILAIYKMATDAVDRIMDYIASTPDDEPNLNLYVCKGIIQGSSSGIFSSLQQAFQKINIKSSKGRTLGCLSDSSKKFKSSSLWTKPAVVFDGQVYQREEDSLTKYGCRLAFNFESQLAELTDLPESVCFKLKSMDTSEKKKIERQIYDDASFKEEKLIEKLDEIKIMVANNNASINHNTASIDTNTAELQRLSLSNKVANFQEPISTTLFEKYYNYSFKEKQFLINRNDEEQTLINKMRHSFDEQKGVILSGLAGIGKTTAAKYFCNEVKNDFDHIIWIDADNSQMRTNLNTLLNYLCVTNIRVNVDVRDLWSLVLNANCLSNRKCLFIFDRAEDEFVNIISSCLSNDYRHYVITSETKFLYSQPEQFNLITLSEFSEDEATEFINHKTNLGQTVADEDAIALCTEMQGHPLALKASIQHIKFCRKMFNMPEYSIPMYLEEFRTARVGPLLRENVDDYDRNVYTALLLSFEKIKTKEDYGTIAVEILQLLAHLSPQNIDPQLFLNLEGRSRIDIAKALYILQDFCMLSSSRTGNSLFYEIHRLVQLVIRIRIDPQDQTMVLRKGIEMLEKFVHPHIIVRINASPNITILPPLEILKRHASIESQKNQFNLHSRTLYIYASSYSELRNDFPNWFKSVENNNKIDC